jgi:hypothetical protein
MPERLTLAMPNKRLNEPLGESHVALVCPHLYNTSGVSRGVDNRVVEEVPLRTEVETIVEQSAPRASDEDVTKLTNSGIENQSLKIDVCKSGNGPVTRQSGLNFTGCRVGLVHSQSWGIVAASALEAD